MKEEALQDLINQSYSSQRAYYVQVLSEHLAH